MKTYFDWDYISYFKDLEKNNNIKWFDENRDRFEETVRKPFIRFVEELIPELFKIDPKILPDSNKSIFKINRDVSYSRDKNPFYTMMRAGISREGRGSGFAGYYFGIGSGTVLVGGGMFSNNSQKIRNIRDIIADKPDDFLNIVHNADFRKYFGDMETETSRRLAPKFAGLKNKVPEIARKQFYIMRKRESEDLIVSDNLSFFLLDTFTVVKPYNKFFNSALENAGKIND